MKKRIQLRHELSDGRVLIIQYLRATNAYCCYLVPLALLEAPESLCESGTLDQCEEIAADCIRDDVLELEGI